MTRSSPTPHPPEDRPGAPTIVTAAALFVIVVGCGVVFGVPGTRPFGRMLIHENGPVEMATFFAFMAGGVIALTAAWRTRRMRGAGPVPLLTVAFAIAWMFAGMEEISWGQSLVGFASPAGLERINVQNETNVHNLEGVQDLHSFLLFVLGAGGLALAAAVERWRYPDLRAPGSTRACLFVVAFLGLFDWITDNYPFGDPADTVIGMLAEVNEMVLAFAGLLFAITLALRFRARMRAGEPLERSSPRPV